MGIQINQLTATTPGASQSLPVYDPAKGDSRRFSLSDLLTWIQANTTEGLQEANTQYSAPVDGGTILVDDNDEDTHLIITPAAALVIGLTITLPAMGSLRDKQRLIVNCTQDVAALAINGNGATVGTGAPIALLADDYFTLKYDATLNVWYRIG
jgi:hypothetical protein